MKGRARDWLYGAILGVSALWLSSSGVLGLVLVAAVAIPTVFPHPNAAYAGGLLSAASVLALYFDAQSTARCAATNGPSGSCVVVADPALPLFILMLLTGTMLTVLALKRRREA